MKTFEFTIIASGLDPATHGFEDRIFEAGCDDATVSFQKGVTIMEFSREAASFSEAVESACGNAARAGLTIERIEPDPLISLSEIAERSGMSRQAISLYTAAKRGADFPCPVAKVTSKHPLWDWSEVATWLYRNGRVDADTVAEAEVVKRANAELASRG